MSRKELNMKDTMILKDGTIIELETGASLGDIRVVAPDRAAMADTWAKLTPENLAVIQVKNEAGGELYGPGAGRRDV